MSARVTLNELISSGTYLGEDKVDAAEEDTEDEHGQQPDGRFPAPLLTENGELEGGEDDGGGGCAEDGAEEPGHDDGDEALVGGEGGRVGDVPQDTSRAGIDK